MSQNPRKNEAKQGAVPNQGAVLNQVPPDTSSPPAASQEDKAAPSSASIVPKSPDLCAICLVAPAQFTVIPCGHQCGCEPCLNRISKDTHHCPICRGPINGILRIIPSGAESSPSPINVNASGKPSNPEVKVGPVAPVVKIEVKEEAELPKVELEVIPSNAEGDGMVLIRANVPEADVRNAVDVCCVIDISGSMGTEATRQEAESNVRHSDGLTYLDVVKHAVKAVVRCLDSADRLSLVAFDQVAETVLKLTKMDALGQKQAQAVTETLQPRGSTNLWAGLLHGMEALRTGGGNRQKTVLLLTDGQPNVIPPKGHITELRQYWDKFAGFSCQIHTFGFGYSLDSDLLLELANEGGGTYAFIPDAPIIGTVFVNTIANVLSTHTQRAVLHLTAANGALFTGPVGGNYPVTDAPWGRVVTLGPLQFGQNREIVVPMKLPADRSQVFLEASLEYGHGARTSVEAKSRTVDGSALAVEKAALRAATIEVGQLLITKPEQEAKAALAQLIARVNASPAAADESVVALCNDLTGRVAKAMDGRERFNRWGKHYLKALFRAHQLQQCTNFIDKGVQVYGGSLFAHLRARGDSIYLSLPPPKPSQPKCPLCHATFDADTIANHVEHCMTGKNVASVAFGASSAPAPAPAAPVDMSNYHNSSGGCFGAESTVIVMRDGEETPTLVSQVVTGDLVRVASRDGRIETARVKCVVMNLRRPESKPLIMLPGGLVITPSHPVRIGGVWQRPDSVGKPVITPPPSPPADGCFLVYNFVLDRKHILLVNGIECVTLGHGLKEQGVVHPYWGTELVLRDLTSLPGWSQGKVVVSHVWRDENRRVVALWGP